MRFNKSPEVFMLFLAGLVLLAIFVFSLQKNLIININSVAQPVGTKEITRKATLVEKIARPVNWITFVNDASNFPEEYKSQIIDAAREWDAKFGYGKKLRIYRLPKEAAKKYENGSEIEFAETANSGVINIRLDVPNKIRNTILHAMTHASAPENPTILKEPIPCHGMLIIGFEGLCILYQSKNKEMGRYTYIEEGVSERNAAVFKGFEAPTLQYVVCGVLTERYFNRDEPGVIDYVKNNDVPGFISEYLSRKHGKKIKREDVAGPEIAEAWSDYLEAFKIPEPQKNFTKEEYYKHIYNKINSITGENKT